MASDLPAGTIEGLESLDALLSRWSKAVDLTGFKTEDEYLRRYFCEALAALAWLPERGRALDIGTGGGSPALPLALARRSVAWTLVEANERKAMFLDETVRALGLRGASVVAERYENVSVETPFDAVTLRGVAVGGGVLGKIAADLGPGGRFLWFSSKSTLSGARERLATTWSRVEGPIRLVPEGGFLLVADAKG